MGTQHPRTEHPWTTSPDRHRELDRHRGPEQLAAFAHMSPLDMSPLDASREVGSALSGRSWTGIRIFFLAYGLWACSPMTATSQEFHVDRAHMGKSRQLFGARRFWGNERTNNPGLDLMPWHTAKSNPAMGRRNAGVLIALLPRVTPCMLRTHHASRKRPSCAIGSTSATSSFRL